MKMMKMMKKKQRKSKKIKQTRVVSGRGYVFMACVTTSLVTDAHSALSMLQGQ